MRVSNILRLLRFGALLGLVACVARPSPTNQLLMDLRAQATSPELLEARAQQRAQIMRSAGIVTSTETQTPDGVQVVLTTGHVGGVAAVGISADGRYVVSSDPTQVKVWEVASHTEVRSFQVSQTPGMTAAFRVTTGSCRVLLSQPGGFGAASLRDCVTGNQITNASVISEDGNSAATDFISRRMQGQIQMKPTDMGLSVMNLTTGNESILPVAPGSRALSVSANGQTLLTNDVTISNRGVRSAFTGAVGIAGEIASIVVPGAGTAAALLAGGATDATVGTSPMNETMEIVAWNVPTHRKLLTVQTSQLSNLAALSADGNLLVVENKDRSIDGFDLASGRKHSIAPADAAVTGPQFVRDKLILSGNGNHLARQNTDDSVEVFDTHSGQKLATFAADAGPASSGPLAGLGIESAPAPVFSPDANLLAVSSRAQRIDVHELATGRSILQTQATAIAFSADGRTAILGRANEGAPILHDLATGKEEGFGVHLDSVAEVAVTANGKLAIATSARAGGARLWDLTTGVLAATLRTCPGGASLVSARPSPTTGLVAARCADGSVALWDSALSQWREPLSPATPNAPSVAAFQASLAPGTHVYGVGDGVHFSADGRMLAVGADEEVALWNVEARSKIAQISLANLPVAAQPDPLAALQDADAQIRVDPETLKGMSKSDRELMEAQAHEQQVTLARVRTQLSGTGYLDLIRGSERQVTGIALDAAGQQLVIVRGGEAGLWEIPSGRFLRALRLPPTNAPVRLIGGILFSADGRTLFGPGGLRWDVSTGEPITTPPKPAQRIVTTPGDAMMLMNALGARAAAESGGCCGTGVALSPDGRLLARAVGEVVRLSDPQSGEELGDLTGHSAAVTSVAFAPDGRTLISGSEDGSVRVWTLADRKEVVSLYALGNADYVAVRPDQFYRASKSRLSGISFRVGNQLYPFEQFDLRFNRPDLVAEGLGQAPAQEIQDYRAARARRLRKMGFTEAMLSGTFHLPEAQIIGTPPSRSAANSLTLRIQSQDSQYPLDRINVYVNDVPVFGSRGLPVLDRQSRTDDQQVSVPLVPGANKIQVSALNQQGVESFKRTFYTLNSLSPPPGDIYVVAIGVSRYQNSRYNLRFAAKDAADLMNLYSSPAAGTAHGQVHLLDLTNEHATRVQIRQARDWLAQARPNDLAIVFAAGHGVTDARNDYYFGTYDIDAAHPEVNGLAYEEFESLLDGIPPLKKMLLLDTCFSGEIDKEDATVVADAATDGNGTVKMRTFRAPRGIVLAAAPAADASGTPAPSAALTSGTRHFEELFADLRRGTGAVVISSASGNEYALEGDRWNNGVFTYAVLSGLKEGRADANHDGVVTVGELQAYVIDEVRKLTAGGQNPTVRQENLDFDFRIY